MTAIKRLLALAALGLVSLGAAACDDTDPAPAGSTADLVVEYSDWNGWDRAHVPQTEQVPLAGAVGEEVTVDMMGGITIEVVEIDGDEITIKASEPMAPADGASLDVTDLTDTFVVRPTAPATFATPTLDAGWNFEVRLADGGPSPAPQEPKSTCDPEFAGCGQPIERTAAAGPAGLPQHAPWMP